MQKGYLTSIDLIWQMSKENCGFQKRIYSLRCDSLLTSVCLSQDVGAFVRLSVCFFYMRFLIGFLLTWMSMLLIIGRWMWRQVGIKSNEASETRNAATSHSISRNILVSSPNTLGEYYKCSIQPKLSVNQTTTTIEVTVVHLWPPTALHRHLWCSFPAKSKSDE